MIDTKDAETAILDALDGGPKKRWEVLLHVYRRSPEIGTAEIDIAMWRLLDRGCVTVSFEAGFQRYRIAEEQIAPAKVREALDDKV